ncbi:hypothetical protein SVAN01_11052 [Stagonosporopsis vannaccii]|nr:hypothetical protein SVAN01_11052 [Stagonosporopsis vannaccii]
MAPIANTNVPHATATKRKSDDDTVADQSRQRKTARTPWAVRPSRPAQGAPAPVFNSGVSFKPALAPAPITALPPDSGFYWYQRHTSTATWRIAGQRSHRGDCFDHSSSSACVQSKSLGFSQAVPAPFAPWNHNFPAPTPRFAHPLPSCPINWSAITGLTAEQIEAYELRAPWNPDPTTFSTVRTTTIFLASKRVPSEECVRKRFRKACLAIFKCSGVFFEETALGLEDYGVPKQAELRNLIGDIRAAALRTATPTPPPTVTTTTAASTTTASARATAYQRPKRGNSEVSIYTGEVVAFRLKATRNSRPTIRICDRRLVANDRILLVYDVTVTQRNALQIESAVPTLPFSTDAFDRWHASVCFGKRRTFPRRDYVCREVGEGEYLLRDNGKPKEECTTVGLMLETYAVSQAMGTGSTSSMIRREIVRKLRDAPSEIVGWGKEAFLGRLAVDDPLFDAIGVQAENENL